MIDIVLFSFLLATAIAIARMRDLFAVIMLSGIYSLIAASLFITMDAADVAFTEAAVGAGVSTLLLLKTLALVDRHESTGPTRPGLAIAVVIATGALLAYGTLDMHPFGEIHTPSNDHVAAYYLENSIEDTGVPNVVTSILASYRGFDTLGELIVIFTAGIGVIVLLGQTGTPHSEIGPAMRQHLVLRVVAKILIPFIMLFAFYVQFHGEYGPGGGFQAGVIFASAVILYSILFGPEAARSVFSNATTRILTVSGVLLFAGVGIVSMLKGKAFLDYSALAEDPVSGQLLGILLVELGVGITVAAVLIRVFLEFDDRRWQPDDQRGQS